jgi:hypothetical protein
VRLYCVHPFLTIKFLIKNKYYCCDSLKKQMSEAAMLRELKTFIAVTQDGTFAAAGQRIGLTQSAVSAQIRVRRC